MKLSEEVKKLIIEEFETFKAKMYAGKTKKERKALGQFFTPAAISIQMLERFNCDNLTNKTILDPTCGSGNLLIACLFAGADPDKLFGNDSDEVMLKLCKKRLNAVCDLLNKPHINDWQIHCGDALNPYCLTEFNPEYNWCK